MDLEMTCLIGKDTCGDRLRAEEMACPQCRRALAGPPPRPPPEADYLCGGSRGLLTAFIGPPPCAARCDSLENGLRMLRVAHKIHVLVIIIMV